MKPTSEQEGFLLCVRFLAQGGEGPGSTKFHTFFSILSSIFFGEVNGRDKKNKTTTKKTRKENKENKEKKGTKKNKQRRGGLKGVSPETAPFVFLVFLLCFALVFILFFLLLLFVFLCFSLFFFCASENQ